MSSRRLGSTGANNGAYSPPQGTTAGAAAANSPSPQKPSGAAAAATAAAAVGLTSQIATAASYKCKEFETDRDKAAATLGSVKKFTDLKKTFGIVGFYADDSGNCIPIHLIRLIEILHLITALGRKDSDLFYDTFRTHTRPTREQIIIYMKYYCFDKDIIMENREHYANMLFNLCLHTSDKEVSGLFSRSYYTGSMTSLVKLIQDEIIRLCGSDIGAANKAGDKAALKFIKLKDTIIPLEVMVAYFDHTTLPDRRDGRVQQFVSLVQLDHVTKAAAAEKQRRATVLTQHQANSDHQEAQQRAADAAATATPAAKESFEEYHARLLRQAEALPRTRAASTSGVTVAPPPVRAVSGGATAGAANGKPQAAAASARTKREGLQQ